MNKQFIETLINYELSLEGFLILYCLYIKDKDLLNSYTETCDKIKTDILQKLEYQELIKISSYDTHIYFELLSLTEKGSRLISLLLQDCNPSLAGQTPLPRSEGNFDDFRTYYPKVIKQGGDIRRLHGNLPRCRKLYDKLLMETTHEILCKSAKAYYDEHKHSGNEKYMQNLETWLNKKMYLSYKEDLSDELEKTDFTNDI